MSVRREGEVVGVGTGWWGLAPNSGLLCRRREGEAEGELLRQQERASC